MDHEEALLTITAMRRQEETEYFTCDYFQLGCENHDDPACDACAPSDATCRQIMYYWMVRVVDFFPCMSRETVAYAMSYLDRFLQSEGGAEARRKRRVFQLASIGCLYVAVKIHEHAAVSPSFLEKLSNAEFSVKDVERMELLILKSLKWRLSTPTALAFLRQYLAIIPSMMLTGSLREEVFQIAKYQTEVAMSDYKYVSVNASTVAYCALLNALDKFQVDNTQIGWFVSEASHIVRDSIYTLEIQRNLARDHVDHATLKGSPLSVGYEQAIQSSMKTRASSEQHHLSPRTVCKAAAA
jgi:Cyclin, N-terminal domain/Cyclin, C-terminal domain